jgi:hypothetical protein
LLSLLPDRLGGLANNLDELTVRLGELLVALACLLTHPLLANHDHAGGPLCCASLTKLRAALDVDVRYVVVFAKNGDMRNDVHGRDIGSDNDNGAGVAGSTCA